MPHVSPTNADKDPRQAEKGRWLEQINNKSLNIEAKN
jgi:hypothetical protein